MEIVYVCCTCSWFPLMMAAWSGNNSKVSRYVSIEMFATFRDLGAGRTDSAGEELLVGQKR
jgi:hypothetical protein